VSALATGLALAITVVTATATAEIATAAAAATATESATAAAAATESAATTAAAESATATAATTTTTEASARTRGAGLRLVDHESAALKVLAVQTLDGCLACFLRSHGDESESAGSARFAVSSDEDIQHFPVSRKDLSKAVWRRAIVEVSDKELEHVWPPGQFAPLHAHAS
jgi:hypothetical protein